MALSTSDNEYLWRLRLQQQQANAQSQQATESGSPLSGQNVVSAETANNSNELDVLPFSIKFLPQEKNYASQIPVLIPPTGEDAHVDLSKLVSLFRMNTQNTAYQSQKNRLHGEALVNDLRNMASQGKILSNIDAYKTIIGIQTLHTLAAIGAEEAIKRAQEKGLINQLKAIEELQDKLEGLGDFEGQLKAAEQNVIALLTAVQVANANVKTAEAALVQAEHDLEIAAPEDIEKATQARDAAAAELAFMQTEAQKVNDLLTTAQTELDKAQKTAKQGADLIDKIAAAKLSIEQGTYAIDVTEALPKITELISSSASYIEKLADINPQIALKDTFLAELGIQPQSGVSTADLLTSELSSRLRATGMSATEADATAALVVSGGSMEALTLPKTTIDVIQQFNNQVSQATSNSLNTLKATTQPTVQEQNPETSTTKGNIKHFQRVMNALIPEMTITEEETATAFLIAWGESIDQMCELQDKLYEERRLLEEELKKHEHI